MTEITRTQDIFLDAGASEPEHRESALKAIFNRVRGVLPRLVKTLLGLAILGYAGWSLLLAYVLQVSGEAVVAGTLITVTSPIEGVFQTSGLALGQKVKSGQELGNVRNPWIDDTFVRELRNRRELADAESGTLAERRAELTEFAGKLGKTADLYQIQRVGQLRASISETQARLQGERAQATQATDSLERARALSAAGLVSPERFAELERDAQVAAQRAVATENSLSGISGQLSAAKQGVNIDSMGAGTDRPYSRQRQDEVILELLRLDHDAAVNAAVKKTLDEQLRQAERRLEELAAAKLSAQRSGVVWKFLVSSGRFVRRGEALLSVLECDAGMVVATVRRGVFEKLRVGTPARFVLAGDGREFHGEVVQLQGLVRQAPDDVVVAPGLVGQRDPIPQSADPYRVILSFPELGKGQSGQCWLGHSGRVHFD